MSNQVSYSYASLTHTTYILQLIFLPGDYHPEDAPDPVCAWGQNAAGPVAHDRVYDVGAAEAAQTHRRSRDREGRLASRPKVAAQVHLHCVAVWCRVLQCVLVQCSALQCVAVAVRCSCFSDREGRPAQEPAVAKTKSRCAGTLARCRTVM